MRRGVLSMVLGGLIASGATLGGGCGNSGVEFGTGNPGTGGAGGKATSVATGGAGGATSVGSTTSTSGPSTSVTSSTGGTTSSGGGCTVDPQDNACVKCTKQSCCAELVPCQNDQACVCWTGCLSQNPGNPDVCAGCGPYDATTSAFVNCGVQHCSAQCGAATSSSSSTSSGGLCAPAAGDGQCTACAKSKCCNDVNACAASQNCICWVACLAQGASPDACFGACGVPDAATNALSQCSLQQCPGICP